MGVGAEREMEAQEAMEQEEWEGSEGEVSDGLMVRTKGVRLRKEGRG